MSGANVPAPAEDLQNENPSLIALGKIPRYLKDFKVLHNKVGTHTFESWLNQDQGSGQLALTVPLVPLVAVGVNKLHVVYSCFSHL